MSYFCTKCGTTTDVPTRTCPCGYEMIDGSFDYKKVAKVLKHLEKVHPALKFRGKKERNVDPDYVIEASLQGIFCLSLRIKATDFENQSTKNVVDSIINRMTEVEHKYELARK